MAKKPFLYETAFDSKRDRFNDDLDDIDRVTNHAALHSQLKRTNQSHTIFPRNYSTQTSSQFIEQPRNAYVASKFVPARPKPIAKRQLLHLVHLSSIHRNSKGSPTNFSEGNIVSPRIKIHGSTSLLPSTSHHPHTFCGNEEYIRLKSRTALIDSALPAKGTIGKGSCRSAEHSTFEGNALRTSLKGNKYCILCEDNKQLATFKSRPLSTSLVRKCNLMKESTITSHESNPNISDGIGEIAFMPFNLYPVKHCLEYLSKESMVTISRGNSMESVRSSTSEGNRSTSSLGSRNSTTLSSHSSDSDSGHHLHYHHYHQRRGSSSCMTCHAKKMHILSPISDKSCQDPALETPNKTFDNEAGNVALYENSEMRKTITDTNTAKPHFASLSNSSYEKRYTLQNKNIVSLTRQFLSSRDAEIYSSDSGISIESRPGIECQSFLFGIWKPHVDGNSGIDNSLNKSESGMPKSHRSFLRQQEATTLCNAVSADIEDLPFDMPKLRRRLRYPKNTESGTSAASPSLSVIDMDPSPFSGVVVRPKMTLNLCSGGNKDELPLPKTLMGSNALELARENHVDIELPLQRQRWYHGSITRTEAEDILRLLREGSYLVRSTESIKLDFSLSLKSAKGYLHMRIQKDDELKAYILGHFSKPFDSIPGMVRHFSVNGLPIRGAEHMCLLYPVVGQLL